MHTHLKIPSKFIVNKYKINIDKERNKEKEKLGHSGNPTKNTIVKKKHTDLMCFKIFASEKTH